jgi:hypothetical protein
MQRYEYPTLKGYTYDKVVADFGCGQLPLGAYAMAYQAKLVFAIDLQITEVPHNEKVVLVRDSLFEFTKEVDVITAVEVFEHMPNPEFFINYMSKLCKNAFITTPLVEFTHRSRNLQHVAEYSDSDFNRIISVGFDIVDKVYQHGDMSITKEAKPNGDSFDNGHVVQMVWCRSKHNAKL